MSVLLHVVICLDVYRPLTGTFWSKKMEIRKEISSLFNALLGQLHVRHFEDFDPFELRKVQQKWCEQKMWHEKEREGLVRFGIPAGELKDERDGILQDTDAMR